MKNQKNNLCEINTNKINSLEKKLNRMELLLIYCAGALSIKFGSEFLPFISALVK